MPGVITASDVLDSPFTGQSPRVFCNLVTAPRREGADAAREGLRWSLSAGRPGAGCRGLQGYPGTGLVTPHRRRKGDELLGWKKAHTKSPKQVRDRVEHVFARMKTWQVLRDCGLRGDGARHAVRGITRLHNLNLAGQTSGRARHRPRPHYAGTNHGTGLDRTFLG
ncbi:hypothetical protein [uncultured Streptomyces sp.]|uniref:hypothetical protein n=1 Tax=uncultured Streptomyces sp. TaxID=174707 RepID=UPI002610813A|nr:hypothetical protein [uncultured Streptomyces sp.]